MNFRTEANAWIPRECAYLEFAIDAVGYGGDRRSRGRAGRERGRDEDVAP